MVMPEVEFTINTETGEMEMKVEGVQGKSCADVARLAKELLGEPEREENTPEFYVRPQVKGQIKGNR
jgi:hypothetical protein